MRSLALVIAMIVLASGTADAQSAQTPAQASKPAPPAPGQPASAPPNLETPKPAYSYDPENRRDPFLSLLGRGNDPRSTSTRPDGVPGLLISDVTVKGILRNRGGFVAMIQGPDNKTYIIRTGDRLFDGTVKAIVQDKVIFSQDVNDPLSLVKQREIPKAVRPADGRGASPEL